MTSLELERLTFSVDCDVRKWLSLMTSIVMVSVLARCCQLCRLNPSLCALYLSRDRFNQFFFCYLKHKIQPIVII